MLVRRWLDVLAHPGRGHDQGLTEAASVGHRQLLPYVVAEEQQSRRHDLVVSALKLRQSQPQQLAAVRECGVEPAVRLVEPVRGVQAALIALCRVCGHGPFRSVSAANAARATGAVVAAFGSRRAYSIRSQWLRRQAAPSMTAAGRRSAMRLAALSSSNAARRVALFVRRCGRVGSWGIGSTSRGRFVGPATVLSIHPAGPLSVPGARLARVWHAKT